MSRLISDILQAPEPHFSHTIQSWEQLSNRPGHDARLISDVARIRQDAIKTLRLDEADTTPKELYYALRHHAAGTNKDLEKATGISESDKPYQVIEKVVGFVSTLEIPRQVWSIKHTVIKELLKKQPPKKLLKTLGLRSIDSVLKRSNAYELLAMSYQIESADWKEKLQGRFKRLKPADFQAKDGDIFVLDPAKTEKFSKAGYASVQSVIPNYETGTILIIPPKKRFDIDTLGLVLSLLELLHSLRVYSAYFRHSSLKSDFGQQVYSVLRSGLPGKVQELKIGWKPLQRHFNRFPASFSLVEQPYLQYGDVVIVSPLDALGKTIPGMDFWKDKDFAFLYVDGEPVSMHLMDIILNASNRVPYERSSCNYLRAGLWEELGTRYLQSSPIQSNAIKDIL